VNLKDMKRSEFNQRIKNLLIQSIQLECWSNTMFLSSVFLTNESHQIEVNLSKPNLSKEEKRILEKQLTNVINKMDWELKLNKEMEKKAGNISDEMSKLNKLKEEGKIEDE